MDEEDDDDTQMQWNQFGAGRVSTRKDINHIDFTTNLQWVLPLVMTHTWKKGPQSTTFYMQRPYMGLEMQSNITTVTTISSNRY